MGDGDVVTAVATGGPVEVLMVGVIVETGHGTCGTQGRIRGSSGVVSGNYGDGRGKASYCLVDMGETARAAAGGGGARL